MREPTLIERMQRRGVTPIMAGFSGLGLMGVAGSYMYIWYSDGQLYYPQTSRPGIWITYHDHPVEFVYAASSMIFLGLIGIALIVTMVGLVYRRLKYPLGIEIEHLDDKT